MTATRKYTLKMTAMYLMSGALFVLAAAGTFAARRYLVSFEILMYIAIGIFWGLAVIFGLFLLPMFFRRTVIYLSSKEITMHTGLFFLRRIHMRMSAVQYVTLVTLPFSELSGFNFIAVRALGGSLVLPFLNKVDCDEIISALHSEIAGRG